MHLDPLTSLYLATGVSPLTSTSSSVPSSIDLDLTRLVLEGTSPVFPLELHSQLTHRLSELSLDRFWGDYETINTEYLEWRSNLAHGYSTIE